MNKINEKKLFFKIRQTVIAETYSAEAERYWFTGQLKIQIY